MRTVALVMTLMMLTACSGSGPKRMTDAAAPITVALFVHPNDTRYDLAIAAFERRWEHIRIQKVTYQLDPNTGSAPYGQILREKVRKGEVDILPVGVDQADYVKAGLLASLDPFIERSHLDLTPYGRLIDSLRLDGELYQLPIYATPSVLWYDAERFDAAGLPAPKPGWTWDEFRQAAARLTEGQGASKIWGVWETTGSQLLAQTMINQKADRVPIEPASAKEILSFWATMLHTDKSITPREIGSAGSGKARLEGRVAMIVGAADDYDWINRPLSGPGGPKAAGRWEAGPMPTFRGEMPLLGASPASLGLVKESPHIDAAWEFIRFLASEEGAVAQVQAGGFPILRTPAVKEAWFALNPAPPRSTGFLFDLEFMGTTFIPGDVAYLVNQGAFGEAMGKVIAGNADWEPLYREFLTKREALLKDR